MLRPLLLALMAGVLAAPLAANAESPSATQVIAVSSWKALRPVAGVQTQPMTLRSRNAAGRLERIAAIPVKDNWTNDEGFRFAKGRLAFKHRF